MYACDIGDCKREFNFRIKLNKHRRLAHAVFPEAAADLEPSPITLLPPTAEMLDEEKVKEFDSLLGELQRVAGRLATQERRFKFLQDKLRCLQNKNNARTINKYKKKNYKKYTYKTFGNHNGDYEHIENDTSLPAGWRSSYKVTLSSHFTTGF